MFSKLFLVMMLLTFQSVFCGKQKKAIKKLEVDVKTLVGRVSDIEEKKGTLEGRVSDIEEEKGTLEGRVSDIEEEKGTLEGRVSDIEEEKGTLEGRVSDIEEEKGTLEGRVSDIEEEKGTLEGRVSDIEEEKRTLEGRVSDNEEQRETLEGRVSDIEEQRETLEGRVSDIEDQREALESRVRDLEENRDIPRDCQDVQERGIKTTGVYTISPKAGASFKVRCDMDTDGGGWTVIQRRVSNSDFYKTWDEYKVGFGSLNDNFWLGNDNIYTLTSSGKYSLRVDLTAQGEETGYAKYSSFSTGPESEEYRLSIDGYSGNIGDSLAYHNGMTFKTKDRDERNCAVTYSGAWWYRGCHHVNLNGLYGSSEFGKGLNWHHWKGYHQSMTKTQMAIKRVQ